MHRAIPRIIVAATAILALTGAASATVAQSDVGTASAWHPVVGSWFVDANEAASNNVPNLTLIHADGTLIDRTTDGEGIGAWTPTGPLSADVSILYPQAGTDGAFIGSIVVRASIAVSADGQRFSGSYTLAFPSDSFGQPAGREFGPATLAATRVHVEPMGVPADAWPPSQSGAIAVDGAGSVAIIESATSDQLGTYLVGPGGMTLYIFAVDTTPGVSACTGQCAETWPPFIVSEGVQLQPGSGVAAGFDVLTRDDGTAQAVYQGRPLYYFAGDRAPGDTTGQGIGDVWFVATP